MSNNIITCIGLLVILVLKIGKNSGQRQTQHLCNGEVEAISLQRQGYIDVTLKFKSYCNEPRLHYLLAIKEDSDQKRIEEDLKKQILKFAKQETLHSNDEYSDSNEEFYFKQIKQIVPNVMTQLIAIENKLNRQFKYKFGIASLDNSPESEPAFSWNPTPYSVVNSPKTSNLEVILIIVLAILLVITFILLGVLLYINYASDNKWQNLFIFWSKSDRRSLIGRDNRKGYDQSYRCSTLSIGSFHEGSFEPKSHVINLSELSDTIPLIIENDTLKQQFSSVSRGQLMRWDYGKQFQHKSKNRYGNLLPYDHSRVILDLIDNDKNTDYINANYVDGYKCSNRYIATQGPLPETINDMWRMIWQLNCHQIVMLTSLDEGGKNKCDKYWPDQTQTYGNINISLTKSEIFADYIIRTFIAEKDGITRELVQYHFISWPDHTVPMYACSLLTFIGRVRCSSHYVPTQPIVVHCSAGVGRTGTFILLDAMLEMAKSEKQIDVLAHLCVVRQQRINLVEKLGQYVFVHQALLEALSHEPTSIDCNNFHKYYSKLINGDNSNQSTSLMNQFKILNKLSPQTMNSEICNSAKAHQDMNRNQEILPPDYARVILPANQDYINAVYVNGYKRRDAYIVTQIPLECSRSHFWQMITSTQSKTIVLLNDVKREDIYWPTNVNKQSDYMDNKLTIRLISEEHENSVTIRTFHLQHNDTIVKQFHLKGWSSTANKPSSQQIIIDLMEKMEQWNLQSNANSVVVQCFDGNNSCGIYCATAFICDRIKEEQQVDVFLAVQTVRTNRPQFISDLDQYKFLHQMAISYLEQFDLYANFK